MPEPHLVVVPLSTLPNWERELAKWAPQAYVVVIKGNASARATAKKYDCYLPEEEVGGKKRPRPPRRRFSVMLATYETVIQVRIEAAAAATPPTGRAAARGCAGRSAPR